MDFFGMGMGEILLILIVVLIVWGPGKIPEVARTIGRTVRTLRKATTNLSSAVTKEIDLEDKDRASVSKASKASDKDRAESTGIEITGPREK